MDEFLFCLQADASITVFGGGEGGGEVKRQFCGICIKTENNLMKFVNSQICLKLFSYTVDILLHNNVFFIQLAKSLC